MEYVKLEEICTIVSGGTPSRSKPNYWNNGNIPWIKIKDMKSKYIDSAEEFITEEGLNNSSTKMLKRDTILYSIFATLGEVGILKIDACTNQAIAGLSLKEDSNILKEYLYYYLKSKKKDVNNLGRGVAQNNINLSLLRKFKIPVIPLRQQKKIIEVLDNVSSTINNYERELALLDELVKARFVEMFGRPTDKITRYPKVKIGNLIKEGKASIKAGPFGSSLKKEFYVKKGFKIYGQEQVIKNDPTFGDYYINEDRFNSLKSCEVHAGDILISLVGTCGKTMIMPENFEPGIINPRLLKIAFDAEFIIPIYFKYFFGSDDLQKILNSASGHSTMNVVNAGMLKNVELIMAPIELQNQFASFVEEVDKSRLRELLAIKQIKLLLNDLWFLFY
ncbi:type I restriction modification DNA specificity domain protein [Catenibacterium mitsuokai DSM 15897]|uniref:restriction endonuclease subunit S n=1 Tax=Catenibacterium mitsuokai TaxID=100886 RepID=UPI000196CE8E|nr:restriction endonuclease subunit S [Catenibacterium mitsuokai]EEF92548.1 type I restriction modification DNA specificity domain protein [Catenibacterium mitsuokai DSM 15897]UWO53802.1 restriction endonuclease subunit S [Catenibacterium mitsuokai]